MVETGKDYAFKNRFSVRDIASAQFFGAEYHSDKRFIQDWIVEKACKMSKQEGRVEGAIAELKAILHLLDELEGMNFSANWYKRQIELRVKELLGGKV